MNLRLHLPSSSDSTGISGSSETQIKKIPLLIDQHTHVDNYFA